MLNIASLLIGVLAIPWVLLGTGILGLAGIARRRRTNA